MPTQEKMIQTLYEKVIGLPDNPQDNGLIGAVKDIGKQVSETNGSVRRLVMEVFNPDNPEEGLVSRVSLLEHRVTKLKLWSDIGVKIVIFLSGAVGIQVLEELFRDTPMDINSIIQWLMSFMGLA